MSVVLRHPTGCAQNLQGADIVSLHVGSKPHLLASALLVRTMLLEEKRCFSNQERCGQESSSDRSLDRSASFSVSVHSLSVYNLDLCVI